MANPSLCNGVFFAQNAKGPPAVWTALFILFLSFRSHSLVAPKECGSWVAHESLAFLFHPSSLSLICFIIWHQKRTANREKRSLSVQLTVMQNNMFCHTTIGSISPEQWTINDNGYKRWVKENRKKTQTHTLKRSRMPCDTCKLKSCLFYQSSMERKPTGIIA